MEILLFLAGICIGSFLNVLIDRLPHNENIIRGRSHCDYCHRVLRWYELIPIVSYILQGGKCLRCKQTLSIQYPLIEGIVGVSFILLYWLFGTEVWIFMASIVLFCSFLVLFVSDLKYQILPDSMVFLSLIGSILWVRIQSPNVWIVNLAAAIGSFALFWGIWFITRGKGMGFGDVKLSGVLGLFLGYPLIVVSFYTAFLTGAFAGVILILGKKKKLKSKIAFGPFLIFGALVALLWGEIIIDWWRQLL